MKNFNDQSSIKLTPILLPRERPNSANSSILNTKASKSRDIIEKFRQEKTKTLNQRSAVKAKESGKRWSNSSLYAKRTHASQYLSSTTNQLNFSSNQTPNFRNCIESFYSSVKLMDNNLSRSSVPGSDFKKQLFANTATRLNSDLIKATANSKYNIPGDSDKQNIVILKPLFIKKQKPLNDDKKSTHVYGFHRVDSDDSTETSFDNRSESIIKYENLNKLSLKPVVGAPTDQLKEITNTMNVIKKQSDLQDEIKARYSKKLKESQLQKEELESVSQMKNDINKQRLLKIKEYGSKVRERLNCKTSK